MDIFAINEKIKDEMVLNHKAFFAKTIFLSAGALILPEPFYETTVLWDKEENMETIHKAIKGTLKYQKKLKDHMTEIIFEYNLGHPALVWATFIEPESPI
jgi:hypothetical protein